MDDDTRWWLALNRIHARRTAGLLALIRSHQSPRAVFEASSESLRATGAGGRAAAGLRAPDWAGVERDLRWLEGPRRRLVHAGDGAYPPLLARIDDPPISLFVEGDAAVLARPQIAIVGARKASSGGVANARWLGATMAGAGLIVTSGLARGIDAAAHRGALERGLTVAVLGSGHARLYPREHRGLADEIAAGGAVVAELPPERPPHPAAFPRRNRIVSGLGLGVVVVEAARRSGALITARLAAEQGREVFAVPGSIRNPLAAGCHALLRDGAKLVECAGDVFEEVAPALGTTFAGAVMLAGSDVSHDDASRQRPRAGGARDEAPRPGSGMPEGSAALPADPTHRRVLDALGHDPVAFDELVERTRLPPSTLSSALLRLELERRICAGAGGRFTRA